MLLMNTQHEFKKAFELFGGTQAEFAKACDVSQGFVGKCLDGEKKPGWKTCQAIEKVTDGEITRHDLRPDIFGEQTTAA